MHRMLLIDLLGGVLVLVSVICHNRVEEKSQRKRWFRFALIGHWLAGNEESKEVERYQMIHRNGNRKGKGYRWTKHTHERFSFVYIAEIKTCKCKAYCSYRFKIPSSNLIF
jgi:hypothetical protein